MKYKNLNVKTQKGQKCTSMVWILRFELKAIFGGIPRRASQKTREGISRYPPHCFQPWIGAQVASPQSPILRPSKNNFNKNYFPRVDKPVLMEGLTPSYLPVDSFEQLEQLRMLMLPSCLQRLCSAATQIVCTP